MAGSDSQKMLDQTRKEDWEREPADRQQRGQKFTFIFLLVPSSWLNPLFVLCSRQVLHPVIALGLAAAMQATASQVVLQGSQEAVGLPRSGLAYRPVCSELMRHGTWRHIMMF